jgi:nucleoid DNA-binding protein
MSKPQKSGKVNASKLRTLGRVQIIDVIDAFATTMKPNVREQLPGAINHFIDDCIRHLSEGTAVRLKRLGTLYVVNKKARDGARVPTTGEATTVSPQTTISFRTSGGTQNGPVFGWSDMNRSISNAFPDLSVEDIRFVLNQFNNVIHRIAHGETRIEIRGFGSFFPSWRDAKVRRNPKTGETFVNDPHYIIRFKRSTLLFKKMNPKYNAGRSKVSKAA